jgi:ABC-type oligopeptide transport system substrate-binding subunit
MKKIKKGIVLLILSLFLTLTACTSSLEQTKVKVVSLTYETQGQQLRANNIFKLNASKPINYIFPGDELAFTVEIEDPDF